MPPQLLAKLPRIINAEDGRREREGPDSLDKSVKELSHRLEMVKSHDRVAAWVSLTSCYNMKVLWRFILGGHGVMERGISKASDDLNDAGIHEVVSSDWK